MTEQQAKDHTEEIEQMFRTEIKHLVDVLLNQYMPLDVRKFAASYLFRMEYFILKMQPDDWRNAMTKLRAGLNPTWQMMLIDGPRREVKENPPSWAINRRVGETVNAHPAG